MSALLTVIAINTLLFLGLSVAKFVPWPEPVHPRMLRRHLRARVRVPRETRIDATTEPAVRQWLLIRLIVGLSCCGRSLAGLIYSQRLQREVNRGSSASLPDASEPRS